ncbi:MAG TPA: Lrp/AsnC family transcriptional regulator [Gammaproteobacteria bacterium]|nr:Lrp/AsnC family transcriptional regulator [Gammaproteobacteria bacterium]
MPVQKKDRDRKNQLEHRLLNDFQHGLPLSATPFADMAEMLGVSETEVLETLQQKKQEGVISRVGAVFRPNGVGVSTLAAMAVPENDVERIAEIINVYEAVNHNYQREHHYNLWFVLTAENQQRLAQVIESIEQDCGYRVMSLPMLEDFHIDLGFDIKWT